MTALSSHPAGLQQSLGENLLISVCFPSGTTLLEKLLHTRQNISQASQPFPVLWFHLKMPPHHETGRTRRYPLDHLFLEGGYTADDVHASLDRFESTHALSRRHKL
jgi:hypothetical protein